VARIPSIVVLGTDAVTAVLPSTAVQLAHACRQAGYDLAVPVSWGDELVAGACLGNVARGKGEALVLASCPRVRERLRTAGDGLLPNLMLLAAPPVAVARQLRQMQSPDAVHITYVGACPDATDSSIDEQILPADFISRLRNRGIHVPAQPRIFDSVVPPDRRRHLSQPGGLPAPELLWSHGRGLSLVEIHGDDVAAELVQYLLASEPLLIDMAPRLGCQCSGATEGVPARSSRASVVAGEPPRSSTPVFEHDSALDLTPG
jgi:hypothetical protein